MLNKINTLGILFLFFVCFACEAPITPSAPPSDQKLITSFVFDTLSVPAIADINGNVISVLVPHGTDRSRLVARFSYEGCAVYVDSVLQESGISENDYSGSLRYKVEAENGSTCEYLVVVKTASPSENRLNSIALSDSENVFECKIESDMVSVTIPPSIDATNLRIEFNTAGKNVYIAGIPQISGISRNDFTIVNELQVEAYDGKIRKYSFILNVDYPKEFHTFSFSQFDPAVEAVITNNTIFAKLPFDAPVRTLIPEFSFSGKAVYVNGVPQESGVTVVDFSSPVLYSVEAEDGSRSYYEVSIDSTDTRKDIKAFKFEVFSPDVHGKLLDKTILLTFPEGANISSLSPSIDAHGSDILIDGESLIPGKSRFDFSKPVQITIVAEDGSQKEYVATTLENSDLFVTSWDLTYYGASTDIVFPLDPDGVYDFYIDWGDGTGEFVTDSNLTHTYSRNAVYDVIIEGTIEGFGGREDLPLSSLSDIKNWGTMRFHNKGFQLHGSRISVISDNSLPDLSNVTNMHAFFSMNENFDSDISLWDVSAVTDMSSMFQRARIFNQNIGPWNTGNVTDMSYMFANTLYFNQNIGAWNTGNVSNMTAMFEWASHFNQNIGSWNTVNVTDMSAMFNCASHFNQNIGAWDTGKVKNMAKMFSNAELFNQNIGAWNTSSVTDMSNMFDSAYRFNHNIGAWNTENVTTMKEMFSYAFDFNQNIGAWNTGKVTDMSKMFQLAYTFNQNLSSWNTDAVTTMSGMFFGAFGFNGDIRAWDTTSVHDMSSMFASSILVESNIFNQDISSWNVENVTDMNSMFKGATLFDQNIGGWNVGKVTDMRSMFESAATFNQDISSWNVENVTDMNSMFKGATLFDKKLGVWKVGNVTDMSSMFESAAAFNQDISEWNVGKVTTMESMFKDAGNFNQSLTNWNTISVTNMMYTFQGASAFNSDIGGWDLTNVTNVRSMFENAVTFNKSVNDWNVSNIDSFWDMFKGATSFNQPLNNWITSSATDMEGVFMNAAAFDQDISGWDTSGVQYMDNMLNGATLFNQDLTSWDVNLITAEPADFALNSALLPVNYPVWGTTGTPITP